MLSLAISLVARAGELLLADLRFVILCSSYPFFCPRRHRPRLRVIRLVVFAGLEFQPQGHLHYTLVRERSSVHTERIWVVNPVAHGHSVETHAIGHVEYIPS